MSLKTKKGSGYARAPELAENTRLRAVNAELVAALENIVEHGTDSPQHRAAEAALAKAKEVTP